MKLLPLEASWASAVYRAAAALYAAGATAVWLFGSRARERAPDRLSDFDLGVEGLPDGGDAMARATRELGGRVHIVRLEQASAPMRWEIARQRMLVPHVPLEGGAAPAWSAPPETLADLRTQTVAQLVHASGATSAIDFGCGTGQLVVALLASGRYERLTGVDFDPDALAKARGNVARAEMQGRGRGVVELREGLITYRDPAYLGHAAATAVEVIEHLEPPQLEAFAGVLFGFVRPRFAVVTTPNFEYNALWPLRRAHGRRHADHRFEWTRAEFEAWAERAAAAHGYRVRFYPVGASHPAYGAPTQLAAYELITPLASPP